MAKYKPVAIIYPLDAKRPEFVGYAQSKKGTYTVYKANKRINSGIKNIFNVFSFIETRFGTVQGFKMLPLWHIDSLIL